MAIINELRYGNLFLNPGGEPEEYRDYFRGQINPKTYSGCTDIDGYDENEIHGIPLTEKWMQAFGMVTLDNEIDQIVWGFSGPQGENICYVSDGFRNPLPIYFEYDSGVQDIRKEIKYIHQLQNLHFFLTGEELKIKEV